MSNVDHDATQLLIKTQTGTPVPRAHVPVYPQLEESVGLIEALPAVPFTL